MQIEQEHSEMVGTLAKRGDLILAAMTPASMHLLHMAVGVAGEASELMEAIVDCKILNEVDIENITEELGDSEFYLEGFRQGIGIPHSITTTKALAVDYSKSGYGEDFALMADLVIVLSMTSGQLLDAVKKVAIYSKAVDLPTVMTYLCDIEFCLEGIRQSFGIIREETLEHNVDKLIKGKDGKPARYHGGQYSDEAAQNRADKA